MTESEFNLLDEPWIKVMTVDGMIESVGLKEVFSRADRIRSVCGDIPAQDAVILRLLLSILYAVHLRSGREIVNEEGAYAYWADIYGKGRFDIGPIDAYLESFRDRFWLFDDEHPFFQSNITDGTECSATKLNGVLSETTSKPRLFRTVSGSEKKSMDYADAARWLLYLNAYDDTSLKPTVRRAGLPSVGTGWLGKLGLVYAEGDNLFETLLFNMPLSDDFGYPFRDGTASWERDVAETRERVVIDTPNNPIELLTLQSRRVKLRRTSGRVTGYLVMGGDIADPEMALTEQMTEWYMSKHNTWMPRRHDPYRSMWRDLSYLMLDSDCENRRKPGIVRWISGLVDRSLIPPGHIRIRAVGVRYADKNFFVTDLVDDQVTFDRAILSGFNGNARAILCDIVEKIDDCVSSAVKLASRIMYLSGVSDDVRKRRSSAVRSEVFAMLDSPFRSWVATFDPGSPNTEETIGSWKKTLEKLLLDYGSRLAEDANGKAFRGCDSPFS